MNGYPKNSLRQAQAPSGWCLPDGACRMGPELVEGCLPDGAYRMADAGWRLSSSKAAYRTAATRTAGEPVEPL
ncbi:hypothetical protein [Ravibacter arvi]|uniref:hypothetical protein n=1 Tax=Ravibacter arvi TaxID=2051041 RepID=UPI0031ED01AD